MDNHIMDRLTGKNGKTFIIAEAGVNHNGDIDLAKKLITAAKKAGADAVKFQTFKTENVVTKSAKKADYQMKDNSETSQYEMIKKLELSQEDFSELSTFAKKQGIIFTSSPFDKESVDFLDKLNVDFFKIASGEITNFPLIEQIAQKEKPIILSTGMANLGEIEESISLIRQYSHDLILMHCVTSYPVKPEHVNLNAIKTLQCAFQYPVGFSDHTLGIDISMAAVALGSCVIEKHFTMDKNLPGPDHKASLDPDELTNLVKGIHNVDISLGDGLKRLSLEESKIKPLVRKSLVSKMQIPAGTILTNDMIAIKRPGTGIPPKNLKDVLGKKTNITIEKDEILKWDFLI